MNDSSLDQLIGKNEYMSRFNNPRDPRWMHPTREEYEAFRQLQMSNSTGTERQKWENIKYIHKPLPYVDDQPMLALQFSHDAIVPVSLRWRSIWMMNVFQSTSRKRALTDSHIVFGALHHFRLWPASNPRQRTPDTWRPTNPLSERNNLKNPLDRLNALLWTPETLVPISDRAFQELDTAWGPVPTVEEFQAILDFLPGDLITKLQTLNIPLAGYEFNLDGSRHPTAQIDRWYAEIMGLDYEPPGHSLHGLWQLAMLWCRNPYRNKLFTGQEEGLKPIFYETMVFDTKKNEHRISDIEQWGYCSIRCFV